MLMRKSHLVCYADYMIDKYQKTWVDNQIAGLSLRMLEILTNCSGNQEEICFLICDFSLTWFRFFLVTNAI